MGSLSHSFQTPAGTDLILSLQLFSFSENQTLQEWAQVLGIPLGLSQGLLGEVWPMVSASQFLNWDKLWPKSSST